MGKGKTNMFEAFRATANKGPAATRAQDPARAAAPALRSEAPAGVDPTGAEPAATFVPRVPGGPPLGVAPRGPLPPVPADEGFALPFGAGTFIALQVAVLGVAFYLGMLTARDVGAAGPTDAPDAPLDSELSLGAGRRPAEVGNPVRPEDLGSRVPPKSDLSARRDAPSVPDPRGAGPQGSDAGTGVTPVALTLDPSDPAVAAFLDPRNVFTLQVVSYDDTKSQRALAEHWRGVLAEKGFPVVLHRVKSKLALFVGASPNAIEIDELAARVRDVKDGRGQPVFPEPRSVLIAEYR